MLSSTIIICTYNRPQLLESTLRSILDQKRLPDQIIVVDDGQLPGFPLYSEFESLGIEWIYIRKQQPGLTESRAEGSKKATKDIILFTDDDVKLEPDYVHEIMAVFEGDAKQKIGGVGGRDENGPQITLGMKLRHLWDRFFLISSKKEGQILASGFCAEFENTPYPITRPVEVDVLAGLTMSFRREVLLNFPFTPKYHEYALDEDKDITYRISRKYRLISTPKAKLYHFESRLMRPDKRNTTFRFLSGRYIFFRKYVYKNKLDWIYFDWAILGYTLFRLFFTIITWKKESWQRLLGITDFFKALYKNEFKNYILIKN